MRAKPSRIVSSRTSTTPPIAVLFQPESQNRIARSVGLLSPSRCSSLGAQGDLPDMRGPLNHLITLNLQTFLLATQRRVA